MRRLFLFIFVLVQTATTANATTYFYEGQPLTVVRPSVECGFSLPCTFTTVGLTANVSFSSDTSAFTGTLMLSPGDTAFLSGPGIVASPLGPPEISYPFNNPPPGTPGFATFLSSATFSFVDGSIISWSFGGGKFFQMCGGGPGCAAAGFGISTSSAGDSISQSDSFGLPWFATNTEGGTWAEVITAPVPEPSTWAMLLIGFAGIGFASYRKSRRENFMGDWC
jgi:hypothetical protein